MCFKRLCSWKAENFHKKKRKRKLVSTCIIAAFCWHLSSRVLHITLSPFIWAEVINTFSIIKALGTEDEILPLLKSMAELSWTWVPWVSGQKRSLDCPVYHWYWCCVGLLPILQMASKLWIQRDRKPTAYPWRGHVPMISYHPTKKILYFILLSLPSLKFQALVFL